MPDAPGLFLPVPDSPHMRVWCVAQNSHSCSWVSVNRLVSSPVELPSQEVWGCLYREIAPPTSDVSSSFSSGVGYLFYGFWSIWVKCAQSLVVNFVVFRREVELQSFCSTILIPSLSLFFFSFGFLSAVLIGWFPLFCLSSPNSFLCTIHFVL